ncbi:MAG: hypothetical protein U0637_11390 [Phycisphaerales bacterium]
MTTRHTAQPRHLPQTDTLDPIDTDTPPATPDALHAWLRRHLALSIPRTPVLKGHAAPFDYLTHAFFEGRGFYNPRPIPQRLPLTQITTPHAIPLNPRDNPLDCVVWANRGGGKTFLGAVATLLDLTFKPGIEVRILGGSMEQSGRMHAHLRRLFSEHTSPALAALVKSITRHRLHLKNGSAVELLSQSETSVRGTRVQRLRCDEADLFDPEVWEAAQLTTRSARCGNWDVTGSIECLSTMHRPHGLMANLRRECRAGLRTLFRWGVVDILEKCGDQHTCAPVTPGIRPCPLLPECKSRLKDREEADAGHMTVADAIAMKRRVSHAKWNTEMLCLRSPRSTCVYPEFEVKRHVCKSLKWPLSDPGLTWVAGMDFGMRAPTVILWAAVERDGFLTIVDERVKRGLPLGHHLRAIKAGLAKPHRADLAEPADLELRPPQGWPPCTWLAADPAGDQVDAQTGRSNIDVLRAAGLTVRARRTHLLVGLERVRARLSPAEGPPRIAIHARCKHLIESLERYHYPEDKPDSERPKKGDGHDHAADALRYLITSLDCWTESKLVRYA